MEAWFDVNKSDVIALIEKRKDCMPWGEHPDEKYICLVFWEDGVIRMTVDEFFEVDENKYSCCRFFTTILADTLEEYENMSEEKFVSIAYNAWCTGAR